MMPREEAITQNWPIDWLTIVEVSASSMDMSESDSSRTNVSGKSILRETFKDFMAARSALFALFALWSTESRHKALVGIVVKAPRMDAQMSKELDGESSRLFNCVTSSIEDDEELVGSVVFNPSNMRDFRIGFANLACNAGPSNIGSGSESSSFRLAFENRLRNDEDTRRNPRIATIDAAIVGEAASSVIELPSPSSILSSPPCHPPLPVAVENRIHSMTNDCIAN
mmetsp:Transcript_9161/g.18586  ORF Transcript_9161/g.18586 Transcript_9161/m.18586 type:complete len:226 (-) Transcript_9161:339-1016(-)